MKRVEALVEVNMPGPMSYRSVYKTYQHLLTQEAENNTDQFLRGEHDLLEYQKVSSGGSVRAVFNRSNILRRESFILFRISIICVLYVCIIQSVIIQIILFQ